MREESLLRAHEEYGREFGHRLWEARRMEALDRGAMIPPGSCAAVPNKVCVATPDGIIVIPKDPWRKRAWAWIRAFLGQEEAT